MIVCLCHNVSTGDIAREAAGCCSFESLQEQTMVGMSCGACVSCARDTFHEHKADQPDSGESLVPAFLTQAAAHV